MVITDLWDVSGRRRGGGGRRRGGRVVGGRRGSHVQVQGDAAGRALIRVQRTQRGQAGGGPEQAGESRHRGLRAGVACGKGAGGFTAEFRAALLTSTRVRGRQSPHAKDPRPPQSLSKSRD